jgi:hypothetical protein
MAGPRIAVLLGLLFVARVSDALVAPASPPPTCARPVQEPAAKAPTSSEIPRGKKLILKDGTFQVVREYQRNGERVRYFSQERGDWEELPASLVDWDATAKADTAAAESSRELVEKIHKQEEGQRMDNVTDIDASLLVAKNTFLPNGEGMFVLEGQSIRVLNQVGSAARTDKLRVVEQVFSPVAILPNKRNVVIAGAHATLRLKSKSPEFYLREPPEDPNRVSQITKSSRIGDNAPDVELIRVKVLRNERQLESIRTLYGVDMGSDANTVAVQRWEVAADVYRFTLSQPLPPGEYVLAEILPGGLNLFVWDFGVDAEEGSAGRSGK